MDLTGLDPKAFGSARIREELIKVELVEIAPIDQWRIKYLCKLLDQRQQLHYSGNKCEEEIVSILINSLCVN